MAYLIYEFMQVVDWIANGSVNLGAERSETKTLTFSVNQKVEICFIDELGELSS